jgi:capsular exopolysaccharide synthesis family protein
MGPIDQTRGREELPLDGGKPLYRELWQAIVEKAWLIACILLVAGALGVWNGSSSPVIYQSRAVLFFDFGEQKVVAIEEVAKGEKGGVDLLNTLANNLKSSGILKRVVVAQNLTQHPYFTRGTNSVTEPQVVRALAGAVDARLRRFTRLIDVTVEMGDPALAQVVAQSVVEEFIKQSGEDRMGVGQSAGQILLGEEGRIKERLSKAELAVQSYLRTNNISLSQDANILSDEFKALSSQCTDAKTERLQLEADWEITQRLGGKVEQLLTLTSVSRAPETLGLKEKLQVQEANVSHLQLRYKDKHPAMIQARNDLASLQKAFEEEVLKAPLRIQRQRDAAVEKERRLELMLKEQEKKLGQLGIQRIEYDRLQREAATERQLYDTIIKRLREIDVTNPIKKNDVRIMEPATLPSYPIRPNKRMILIYSLAMGAVVGFGLVWLLQQLDTTIKSVDHAERLLGLPVLGAVPKNKLVKDGKSRLFMSEDPQSLCAEAFRSLRASLGLLGREEERKIVLFTSAVPSEGKSFCCVNYAVAHAQQGKRTLVVDFDLRKPSLAETFGVNGDLPGVTDVMLGKEPLDRCVQETRFDNLFLLTAGRMVPNPAELMSGPWAKQLIHEAAGKYDQVVLDNAPVNAVSDALLIVKEAQTVCLVMHAKKTSSRVVLRALEMLRRAGGRPSGVVLNFLPESAGSGYYYYYSGNKYYGNKGVYGSTSTRA